MNAYLCIMKGLHIAAVDSMISARWLQTPAGISEAASDTDHTWRRDPWGWLKEAPLPWNPRWGVGFCLRLWALINWPLPVAAFFLVFCFFDLHTSANLRRETPLHLPGNLRSTDGTFYFDLKRVSTCLWWPGFNLNPILTTFIAGWGAMLPDKEDQLSWKGIFVLLNWLTHWIDLSLKGHLTASCPCTCGIIIALHVLRSSGPFYSHSLPHLLSTSLILFDVISKSRSPWQQLVTSSSPTLLFDGCFLFWRVCRSARTSLALRQLTCSGGRKEQCCHLLVPRVLHTAADCEKHPAPHCDSTRQPITCQLGWEDTSVSYFASWKRRYVTEVPLLGRSPQLYLPFRKVIGWKKQRVRLPACRFCYELQPCTV